MGGFRAQLIPLIFDEWNFIVSNEDWLSATSYKLVENF